MINVLAGLLVVATLAAPAAASEPPTISKTYTMDDANSVELNFPSGDLFITAAESNELGVSMIARCASIDGHCDERARDVRLVSDTRGKTRTFKLEGLPKQNIHGLSVELRLRVPKSCAITVDMGAGDVDISGLQDHIALNLGAGDASVHLPEMAVRSVRLGVGVGDVSLTRRNHRLDGSGFISRRLKWLAGSGSADIDIHLGAGDVDVTLD